LYESDLKSPKLDAENDVANPSLLSGDSALRTAAYFIRYYWRRILSISAILLVPCFWHKEIEAADLGSHLYNAWLVQLIQQGRVHGLWIDHRWNNILFDYLLSGLASVFGLHSGERIAVSLCVLVFFWGMFALVSAAAQREPWYLVPGLAAFAYGWTFEMGFFNYYLALGLSFFAIAIFWRGKGRERLIALAIAPLVLLAHPLGLFWLGGACAYVWVGERIPPRLHIFLLLGAVASLLGVHRYLWSHYAVEAQTDRWYWFNGADQLVLFGQRYRLIERGFLVFAVAAIAFEAVQRFRQKRFWASYFIPLQLYALVCVAVVLLPRGIRVPEHIGAIALLTDRLTSVSAVLLLCVIGALRPYRWHFAALLAVSVTFFAFVYQDTGSINRMEEQVVGLVHTLPPNQRVMATILPPSDSRVPLQHIVDRACIGYCFSYGNYEPGTSMFRVRAMPGNPYVLSNYELAVEMEEGDYTVRPEDLPVYQVYQCTQSGTQLCIHALEADEDNDDLGVHPDQQ
jgi:hypothetical protein